MSSGIVKRIFKEEKIVFNEREHFMYELVKCAIYIEMFGAIANGGKHLRPATSEDDDREEIISLLKKKKMYFSSKESAVKFCENNRKYLNEDCLVFLLFEEDGKLFVASVHVYSDGVSVVMTHPFEDVFVWQNVGHDVGHYYLVCP